MEFSPYQEAIFDWARNGEGHAVVNAVAGSGKTFTLVNMLKNVKGQVQFLAFNKHIAEELSRRVPPHVQVSTTNAFGNRVFRLHTPGARFDQYKTWNILEKLLLPTEQHFFKLIRNQVGQIVSLYKAGYNGKEFPDVANLIAFHGITFPSKLSHDRCLALAESTAARAVADTTRFDFDDQILMPVLYNMNIPIYDWVCVDEAQDLNAVQLELISRMLKPQTGRLMAVGDPHQAIYLFRGANPDSMQQIVKRFNAKELPLSVCYRCPIAVVKAAKEIVPQIEWSDSATLGSIRRISMAEFNPQKGEFVLCRTTAPLVRECLKTIRSGKTASVKGRDIGEGLLNLFKSIGVGEEIIPSLEQYRALQMARLKDKPEAIKVAVNDQIDTLVAIAEYIEVEKNGGAYLGNNFVASMEVMIDKLFSNHKSAGIQFSTIHRSKGEEYQDVYIIRPDLLPHPKCSEGIHLEQEYNLKYVGITRAQQTLTWVDGER